MSELKIDITKIKDEILPHLKESKKNLDKVNGKAGSLKVPSLSIISGFNNLGNEILGTGLDVKHILTNVETDLNGMLSALKKAENDIIGNHIPDDDIEDPSDNLRGITGGLASTVTLGNGNVAQFPGGDKPTPTPSKPVIDDNIENEQVNWPIIRKETTAIIEFGVYVKENSTNIDSEKVSDYYVDIKNSIPDIKKELKEIISEPTPEGTRVVLEFSKQLGDSIEVLLDAGYTDKAFGVLVMAIELETYSRELTNKTTEGIEVTKAEILTEFQECITNNNKEESEYAHWLGQITVEELQNGKTKAEFDSKKVIENEVADFGVGMYAVMNNTMNIASNKKSEEPVKIEDIEYVENKEPVINNETTSTPEDAEIIDNTVEADKETNENI